MSGTNDGDPISQLRERKKVRADARLRAWMADGADWYHAVTADDPSDEPQIDDPDQV